MGHRQSLLAVSLKAKEPESTTMAERIQITPQHDQKMAQGYLVTAPPALAAILLEMPLGASGATPGAGP